MGKLIGKFVGEGALVREAYRGGENRDVRATVVGVHDVDGTWRLRAAGGGAFCEDFGFAVVSQCVQDGECSRIITIRRVVGIERSP